MAGLGSEVLRKSLHIAMGGFAFLLRWLSPWQAAAVAGVALLFNLFVLDRITGRKLLREAERQRGFSFGIIIYPAVVLALVLVFFRRLELAAGVWALIAFGDGFATMAGVLLRGPKLPWNSGKSWSGFIAFVFWGTAMSAILIRWTQLGVLPGQVGSADAAERSAWVGTSFLDASGINEFWFLVVACFVVSVMTAFVESLDTGIDDNILVPLVGGLALYGATLIDPGTLLDSMVANQQVWIAGAVVNLVLAILAYMARGVTVSGAVWGWLLGTALYGWGGWRGFLMLFLFFFLGTAATKFGYAKKAALGIAQEKGGRRGAKNAFANTLTGVLFALLYAGTGSAEIFMVGLVAAFATAANDTCASEFGQAYGRHHYLVTNFRPVKAGTDGAVSVEGTLGGIAGSAVLAVAAWGIGALSPAGAIIAVVAAFIGATAESYLGATVESVKGLDNELVNFTNTLIGALAGCGLYALL